MSSELSIIVRASDFRMYVVEFLATEKTNSKAKDLGVSGLIKANLMFAGSRMNH